MVRKAGKKDIQAIIELLHQVDMVHHVIREGNDPALSFYRNMGMKVQKTTMEIIL